MQQITDLKDKANSIATRTNSGHNAKVGFKTGPSPDSFYHIGFLKKQTDHIPKRIENLLAKLKEIKANEASPSDDLKARSDELEDRIRRLGVQREIAKDILQKHEQSRSWRLQEQTEIHHYHTELTIPPHSLQAKTGVEETVDFGSCE
ncbi:hypothetical protein BASA60_004230 [Batrachochytrium salamandrivorans]|nr:hypothetical protein BASA60_004230 [Batrachochytrium salamandrivorans]